MGILRQRIWILFALLLMGDLSFSLVQYLRMPLDGDVGDIALPSDRCDDVLQDPLGISVWTEDARYISPNRWAVHWMLHEFMTHVPQGLQTWLSPIDSVYWAAALMKGLMHALLLGGLLLWVYGAGIRGRGLLLGLAVMGTAFFQATDYHHSMGFIDQSLSYASFYALPMGLLLLYFYPFFRAVREPCTAQWPLWFWGLMLLGAAFQSLGGPLTAPMVLLVAPGTWLYLWYRAWRRRAGEPLAWWHAVGDIPAPVRVIFPLFACFALYSFYLGTFNLENAQAEVDLVERYLRLPEGLLLMLTARPGPWLLLLITLGQLWLWWRVSRWEGAPWVRSLLLGLLVFSLVYLLLLPLGGYRIYRPLIIRRDTFLPIYLILVFLQLWSAGTLLRILQGRAQQALVIFCVAVGVFFTLADARAPRSNACERAALRQIQQEPSPVHLEGDCNVMSWRLITDPGQAATTAAMLKKWGIIHEVKRFYHVE